MSITRLQGWALVLSALLNLIGLIAYLLGLDPAPLKLLYLLGGILFIVGLPALISVQPMGPAGVSGVALLELAALIALAFNLLALAGGNNPGEAVQLVSVAAGTLGALIVGWLTAAGRVFPAWVGWAFMLQGVLNLVGALPDMGALTVILVVIGGLADVAAVFGYGWTIAQRPARTPAPAR